MSVVKKNMMLFISVNAPEAEQNDKVKDKLWVETLHIVQESTVCSNEKLYSGFFLFGLRKT